ncbi:MAG: response regulator [Rhodobacteraceae bacterium]|nr:response regulator [Paracoccaceae bacterium]
MPHDIDPFTANVARSRPLVGVTILLAEDSRYCSEAVRLMALRSGARLRRVDSVKSACNHLKLYKPDIVIVDPGLPDGSGIDLIRDVAGRKIPNQITIALSGDDSAHVREAVIKAGAQGFLGKPIRNLSKFQDQIVAILKASGMERVSGTKVSDWGEEDGADLDRQALFDDLDRIRKLLETALPENDRHKLRYCAQFVDSVGQTARDVELTRQARVFFSRIEAGAQSDKSGRQMLELLRRKLSENSPLIRNREHVA